MKRCERSQANDKIGFGRCVSNNSSCQKSRTEFKAAKQKIGLNYKKFLSATRKVEQLSKKLKKFSAVITKLKGAVKEECKNGESWGCPVDRVHKLFWGLCVIALGIASGTPPIYSHFWWIAKFPNFEKDTSNLGRCWVHGFFFNQVVMARNKVKVECSTLESGDLTDFQKISNTKKLRRPPKKLSDGLAADTHKSQKKSPLKHIRGLLTLDLWTYPLKRYHTCKGTTTYELAKIRHFLNTQKKQLVSFL